MGSLLADEAGREDEAGRMLRGEHLEQDGAVRWNPTVLDGDCGPVTAA
jgi:hypothetical protein